MPPGSVWPSWHIIQDSPQSGLSSLCSSWAHLQVLWAMSQAPEHIHFNASISLATLFPLLSCFFFFFCFSCYLPALSSFPQVLLKRYSLCEVFPILFNQSQMCRLCPSLAPLWECSAKHRKGVLTWRLLCLFLPTPSISWGQGIWLLIMATLPSNLKRKGLANQFKSVDKMKSLEAK